MNVFQPAVQINYSERANAVMVHTFSLDGSKQVGTSKPMRHENLPMLFFQLIDRGYRLSPDVETHDGFKVVFAFSPEYVKRVEALQNAALEWEGEAK